MHLEKGGAWFYEREACERAEPSKSLLTGCVANVAGGAAPPPLPIAPEAAADSSVQPTKPGPSK